MWYKEQALLKRRVSVPLRGKGRDQRTGSPTSKVGTPSFPSPCGEKVGINDGSGLTVREGVELLFPSPCGEKVGINPTPGKA